MFLISFLGRITLASRIIKIFVLAAIVLLLGSANASADSNCREVKGRFNIIPVSGADCPSVVGVCGRGTFKGDLRGDYFSPFTSFIPTTDTPSTGVVLFTAETTIANAKVDGWEGELQFKEGGSFNTSSGGQGEFAELFSVVSGTGSFTSATGVLSSVGTFNAATGGEGIYTGQICVP